MSSDDASCSDCKLELIERKWTQLLLNWINKCANPKAKVLKLDLRSASEVVTKYRCDISVDEVDFALLGNDNIEQFIRFKYPILRLRYLAEAKDYPKKMYIMHSILLYHCCASSQTGMVDRDICTKMSKAEQELILRFCENLSEMESTINNVDLSIKEAFELYNRSVKQPTKHSKICKDFSAETAPKTESDETQESIRVRTTKSTTLKFKSSVTVLPSCVTDSSSYSKSDLSDNTLRNESSYVEDTDAPDDKVIAYGAMNVQGDGKGVPEQIAHEPKKCQPGCACTRCSATGPCCGDPGTSMDKCKERKGGFFSIKPNRWNIKDNLRIYLAVFSCFLVILIIIGVLVKFYGSDEPSPVKKLIAEEMSVFNSNAWQCEKGFCQKVYQPISSNIYFISLSRCSLLCLGPQLWPHPVGYTHFSKKLVALATNKLEYKFQSIPSESVHQYLAEAFKLFIGNLIKLEKSDPSEHNETDLVVRKMNIVIYVDTDADPRLRYNTDESYTLKVESLPSTVNIKISSPSFAGVRHGLETLSQMILFDQFTGFLITLSNSLVKDAPSYKYRGLMLDTARNYIPVADIMRTVDTMATVKLNTLHWRISDATSFPLFLPEVRQLFEYGAYGRSMIYTKQDVVSIVRRAGIRGIRVLIEVAVPGPVGRAWSWSPDTSCSKRNDNATCDNILCLRLKMKESVFDILETIYMNIIDLTKVNDVFHLSDGLFSMANCFNLIDDREGFLDKALVRLKSANNGVTPKLPIVWYSAHLSKDLDTTTWNKRGVQMHEWTQDHDDQYLGNFRVIHSSRWELSCHMQRNRCTKYRTWQEMYSWKSWKNVEVFSIEGGEAMLWTDLVDSGNLDYHIWPRLCAVAERLWSDMAANASANAYTYARLDAHRWRMMSRGVKVQPVWPVYCSADPIACSNKLKV
ncbi:unnamed protein product [Chilo suppressalis]|uniref:beta-N-acetylhexosaminidase n=1 Tax=Chilo suppressalis TaxID=168631 RepID=A0ABN8B922_CHISP|nr:unnamed protein product [Chilo suppressalis]